ncbi:hypothetical protein TASIC1_0005043900 [Trichoderma asperellum]|uniref:Uncharacterized protein n=1 Tax=Trichoderma asperellum TaxID=101201 RepID=A0A6V8QSM3_TRIAP|nr:hypothetical protein LI328DRAFT_171463 [Trichoderma asperelloides]GFP55581.1 hypothetical protein TASIC1_0005043900 [Trichoderma asperellum]
MHARVVSVQYLLDGTHSYKLGTRSLQASPQARVRSLGSMRCDAMRCNACKARQCRYRTQNQQEELLRARYKSELAWRSPLGTGPFERARHLVQTRTPELALLHCAGTVVLSLATSGAGPDSALRGTDALREDRVDRPTGLRWVRLRLVNWPEGTWRSGTASQRRLGTCAGTCELAFLALSTAAQLQSSLFPAGTPSRALSPSDV